MLEGLEIEEVKLSNPLATELFRLESEFYTAKSFKISKSFKGEEIIDFVQYGTSEELNEESEGYPVLRLNEFQSSFIGRPSKYCKHIDKAIYESLKLQKNDVLICRTNGNPRLVGKSAIVPKNYEFAYASYLFKIRPKKELINASTLVSFLNSKYGRLEIEKFSMASNQVNFSPAKFREMRIPNFGILINDKIEKLYYKAFDHLEESLYLYSSAETLLLETLGLRNFEPSAEPVNVKGFKESFLTTGRLDAEYYQPKYEEIVRAVKSNQTGYCKLEKFIKSFSTGFPYKSESYSDNGIPLIRINNIQKGELDISNAAKVPFEDIDISPKDVANENDILISMSGTIGSSCKVPKGVKALVNQRIMRITPKNIDFNVLPLIINSIIGQYQLERIGTGGVQTNISSSDIKEIIIPIIDYFIQERIAALVEESFHLKTQSERLLETAKRAVEIAIEQDEEAAIRYIEGQQKDASGITCL